MNLYFVCLGNICRSPLAHKIMEKKLEERGLSSRFTVDSSGLGDWHVGKPSDKRMQETAALYGYRLDHLAQQFHWEDGKQFDYIFAMDRSVYQGILDLLPERWWNKVLMFRKFDPREPDEDVPDPYYGSRDGFEQVFRMVEENCENIITQLLLEKSLEDEQQR